MNDTKGLYKLFYILKTRYISDTKKSNRAFEIKNLPFYANFKR